jgi:hypothetical protein
MNTGASGGKLLGAGAGGFLLLYCEPEYQTSVREALSHLPELPFRFDFSGSSIIYTDGYDIGESRRIFSQSGPSPEGEFSCNQRPIDS